MIAQMDQVSRSKKPSSRANLYRTRRKLRKSLAESKGIFPNQRDLPEDWQKPVIGPRASGSGFRLSVSADPLPGKKLAAGQTVEDLTLSVVPVPESGSTASYIVHCGEITRGPFTLPIDDKGQASGFVTVESDHQGERELVVEWRFRDQAIEASWPVET